MRKWWWLILFVAVVGCSADDTAKQSFPPEEQFVFDETHVETLRMEQVQRFYPTSNRLVCYFVTTYEQAAFLKRNAAYLSLRTAQGHFVFDELKLTLLDRFEQGTDIYYGLKLQVQGSGKEWVNIPRDIHALELLFLQQPIATLNVGTIAFREDGSAYVDDYQKEQLEPVVKMLHERQK